MVSFEGRETPLYTFEQTEQASSKQLRDRARRLRDAFGEARKASLPQADPLPTDRRGLVAWLLDAQIALARLSGLDPGQVEEGRHGEGA